ncbi:hypothetical protein CPT03_21645 [Pedobacter ginsengisoli]|uniref:VWA domain-containing protein n=1 Tax=Pedobacter ginsengisoli TaxID=363852 RepID=A0A2D1UBB4_9SPHI|nr:hypothetical protein [Pedobacter ginsengisoli]ATP58885.1 hypothetical protein CPT03_21645 [Pedobacter ginsengisoli]
MNDSFSLYTLLALLGCLLTGILFAWLLYRKTEHLAKRLRYGLFVIRTTVVSVIAALLFLPLIRSVSYNLEKPVIIIGQDNSLSVGTIEPNGFKKDQYERDMKNLANKLSEKYEVKIYNFSDSIKSGYDFKNNGQVSNASMFINQLNDELLNRNVGAIILSSDGIFNRGGSPLYDLNKLKAPVYTVALGDTIPKNDLMISNVNHNSLVYLDNEFTVEVQVQAFESKGEVSKILVTEAGKKIFEDQIQINSSAFVKNIPIKLKASRLGLQKYTIQLTPLKEEISERNNTQSIFIEVIDAKQKILLASAGPHPDIAALKQAITVNKHYELKIALRDDLNVINPKDYSLIILYQLPDLQNDGEGFINKVQQSSVPVWYILGAQSNLYAFNKMQGAVNFNGNNNTLQEAFSMVNTGFTAFEMSASIDKEIEGFDPLQSPFGEVKINGTALVALKQRIGKIKTESPQLFFMSGEGKRAGYLIGEGIWRWRLAEAQNEQKLNTFNTLISNAVQYISAKDDKRKFKVYMAKNTFDENENVPINAVLYNDSYVAVNTPDVSIQLKNEEGKVYNFLFSRTETAYQLDAGMLPAGNYTYTATTTLGSKKYSAQGIFYVNTLVAEYQQTIANHQLLNTMALQTGGKMYMPQNLSFILNDIEKNEHVKTLSYEDRKYEELINFKWVFALIITMLTLEWFLRKRNGEI